MEHYKQIKVMIAGNIEIAISHFTFQQGTLVNSESGANIAKPNAYYHWRQKRQERFLAGRLALRHAQMCLQLPTIDIHKACDNSPIWPDAYTGSLSHTHSQSVAVILPHRQQKMKGIGVDIEKITHATLLDCPELIGTKNEYQLLANIKIGSHLLTLLLFSLKESIYKAMFPTLGICFDFLAVELVNVKKDVITFKMTHDLRNKDIEIYSYYMLNDDYLLSWGYW